MREELELGVVRIRLCRPELHNALNRAMLLELEESLDALRDANVRALILTGTGKSFCSGADLRELAHFGPGEAEQWCWDGHRVLNKLEDFPAPTLAALNGHAVGGGLELACACDLRYAASGVKLGYPEVKLGMITGWGGTFRFPRLVRLDKAKELIFTGRLILAEEACELGLVNQVFPPEELEMRVLEVAREIAANAPVAVRLAKRMLNRYPLDRQAAATEEAYALSRCMATEDQREGVRAFLEKRSAKFEGR
jgi:enoyl-CoA hydratase